jgi:hypothetical protein
MFRASDVGRAHPGLIENSEHPKAPSIITTLLIAPWVGVKPPPLVAKREGLTPRVKFNFNSEIRGCGARAERA